MRIKTKASEISFQTLIILICFCKSFCHTAATKACPNVPNDCETKCTNYGVNETTGCTTCECIPLEGLFEMDIKFDEKTERTALSLLNNKGKAAGTGITKWTMWPSGGNWLIPYEMHKKLSDVARKVIEDAIADYHANTCIRFIPHTKENKYISFIVGGGCWSYVGVRSSGVNQISIGYGCESKGTVTHEIMHALGFWHEQSRPDRDDHISIIWENIRNGLESQFQILHSVEHYGSGYDTFSVMHYPNWAFTKNGKDTIRRANGSELTDYQRNGFAASDIQQVNAMYQCSDIGGGNYTTPLLTASPSTAAPTTPENTCQDIWSYKKCAKAKRKNKCRKKNVQKNCRKECGVCEGEDAYKGSDVCKDDERYRCRRLIRYCDRSEDIRRACALTCGVCK